MIKVNFFKMEPYCYKKRHPAGNFDIWLLYNLMDDLVSKNSYYILLEELEAKHSLGLTGNASDLSLKNNEVIISDLFDDEKRTLVLKKDVFMELVKKWRSLCEQEVPVITITREGNDFTIEAGTE
jgi:hypothetical protein